MDTAIAATRTARFRCYFAYCLAHSCNAACPSEARLKRRQVKDRLNYVPDYMSVAFQGLSDLHRLIENADRKRKGGTFFQQRSHSYIG